MQHRPAVIKAIVMAGSLAFSACAPGYGSPGLDQAARNYPALIIGGSVHPADGTVPRSCPAAGGRVEQRGGPPFEFLGADPANPDLCRMRIGTDTASAWYGIWLTQWPGADNGHAGLRKVIHGRTGEVAAFDTAVTPQRRYHDLIRNEGIEEIPLLGHTYQAMKISHYREGFGGNSYRSVSTVWKDIPTGLLIYATYQHISGTPELDDPLTPTAILPAS